MDGSTVNRKMVESTNKNKTTKNKINGQDHLFRRIATCLRNVLPRDVYTITHLSTEALLNYPWYDKNCACLLVTDTASLNDQGWAKLHTYFNNSGKFLFICQNSLLSNLTHCGSSKKRSNLLKSAFDNKSLSMALGKNFEKFLKNSLNKLSKKDEINETFFTRDLVGGFFHFPYIFFISLLTNNK
jgi:hypothetical protein